MGGVGGMSESEEQAGIHTNTPIHMTQQTHSVK